MGIHAANTRGSDHGGASDPRHPPRVARLVGAHARARRRESKFEPAPGTHEVAILLGRDQRMVVYQCLRWIRWLHHAETGRKTYQTVSLEWCCLHSIDLIQAGWGPIVMPTPRDADHRFHYCPHEYGGQEEIINLTLAKAKARIRLDDDGAALTYICATYILTSIGAQEELKELRRRKSRVLRTVILNLYHHRDPRAGARS